MSSSASSITDFDSKHTAFADSLCSIVCELQAEPAVARMQVELFFALCKHLMKQRGYKLRLVQGEPYINIVHDVVAEAAAKYNYTYLTTCPCYCRGM